MTESQYNALELLTSGVAHEIKHPLQVMRSGIDILRERGCCTAEGAEEVFDEINRAVSTADRIVMELLDLTRPGGLDKSACDLNAVIGHTLWFMKREMIEQQIHWDAKLDPNAGLLRLNKKSIHFIITQFLRYSVKALDMPGEKRLIINSRKCRISKNSSPNTLQEIADREGESAVLLEMLLSGPDIDDFVILKLFDHMPDDVEISRDTEVTAVHEVMRMHEGFARMQRIPGTCFMAQLVFRDLYPELSS